MKPIRLIVNADDFGMTLGVSRGIITAHREGVLTSTSFMVKRAREGGHFKEILAMMKENPSLGVGLHVEFPDQMFQRWLGGRGFRIEDAEDAIETQIHMFRAVVGRWPDHLDTHKIVVGASAFYPVHPSRSLQRVFEDVRRRTGIPYRGMTGVALVEDFHGVEYDPKTYAKKRSRPDLVSVDALIRVLQLLPEGTNELICHPGVVTTELKSSYREEREIELRTLTASRVRDAIRSLQIELVTYFSSRA